MFQVVRLGQLTADLLDDAFRQIENAEDRLSSAGTDLGAVDSSQVARRFNGKKASQITVPCFQRGGAAGAGVRSATSVLTGRSNHPSMPVRRSSMLSWTIPWADSSHHRRCSEDSHWLSAWGLSNR